MKFVEIEQELLSTIKSLDGRRKNELLGYIQNLKQDEKPSKNYRRRAMKEIREALLEV
jgi:hypothetical protein